MVKTSLRAIVFVLAAALTVQAASTAPAQAAIVHFSGAGAGK